MRKFWNSVKLFLRETDMWLLISSIVTSVFGLLMVYSATCHSLIEGQWFTRDFLIMLIAVVLGIGLCLLISYFNYEVFTRFWLIIGAVCIGSLVLLFPFGTGPQARPDVHTWLDFGVFSIQPSEFVKIGFIITFGVHLERLRDKINQPLSILQLGIHAMIPTFLVMKTGDMGSALVFLVIAAVMLFAGGVHWGYFLGGAALVGAAAPLVWTYVFSSIQKERFLALIHPELYPSIIYQQERGITAIGAGGFSGQGLFHGAYTQAGAVPEAQNDMIFTAVGEELGFLGCIAALGLLCFISIRILMIGRKSRERSTNLICSGMAAMIMGQTVINVGMCLMLLPVIGITLPFFSAGGSSNLGVYLGIGLVLSIYRHNCEQEAVNIRVYDSLKKD
ncbi:MAG: FtsW/RodA/SpoVE family cell cycle protein [Ruminococcus sp.]|nr:FtsW/RodA/SpoVE family cell cycle protein [Ruminococcus sp.]